MGYAINDHQFFAFSRGSCTTCGGELKEEFTEFWSAPNTSASNSSGFGARGGGQFSGSTYSSIYTYAYFWSASYNTSNTGFQVSYYVRHNTDQVTQTSTNSSTSRYSIRCVKNVPLAYAGKDQQITTGTLATLEADSAVTPEKGYWTIIDGGGGSIATPDDPNSSLSGTRDSSYTLVWTLHFAGDTSRDTVIIDFTAANVAWFPGDSWLDKRDGQLYQTTKIGNQTWLAQNLNYKSDLGTSVYYNGDSATYAETFGRLYNKTAVMNGERTSNIAPSTTQGVCPEGWHLPSTAEWDTLFLRINSGHATRTNCSNCAGPLKETFTEYWNAPNSGATNELKFNARGAGLYTGASYSSLYDYTYFWSSSYNTGNSAYQDAYFLRSANAQTTYTSTNSNSQRYSVRCVKNLPDAYAGKDQQVTSGTTATLAADTAVVPEEGKWTIIDGTGEAYRTTPIPEQP
ncbi:hypothetical protein KFE98_15920 [bacterium SCSIO 12741]|nr:hypothetical protein KFE98_15920 [bacterium SCSIO 12741]